MKLKPAHKAPARKWPDSRMHIHNRRCAYGTHAPQWSKSSVNCKPLLPLLLARQPPLGPPQPSHPRSSCGAAAPFEQPDLRARSAGLGQGRRRPKDATKRRWTSAVKPAANASRAPTLTPRRGPARAPHTACPGLPATSGALPPGVWLEQQLQSCRAAGRPSERAALAPGGGA